VNTKPKSLSGRFGMLLLAYVGQRTEPVDLGKFCKTPGNPHCAVPV